MRDCARALAHLPDRTAGGEVLACHTDLLALDDQGSISRSVVTEWRPSSMYGVLAVVAGSTACSVRFLHVNFMRQITV